MYDNFYEWFFSNEDSVMVLLTFVYVVTTIIMVFSNRRLRKLNIDIQKQNVRIQLFEKRYEVYKETEKYITELINNDYSQLQLFALSMASSESKQFDFQFSKIRHLFGREIFDQIIKLNKTASNISRNMDQLTNVYEYIITRTDKTGEFKRIVDITPQSTIIQISEEIKAICNAYVLKNIRFGFETPRDYNYFDLYKEKLELIGEFSKDYKKLLASMEEQLHIS